MNSQEGSHRSLGSFAAYLPKSYTPRAIVLLVVGVPVVVYLSCNKRSLPTDSPSGRFTLSVSTESGLVDFAILDRTRSTVYRASTRASRRMRWGFEWDKEDRLWFYSSDIGVYVYMNDKKGEWTEHSYTDLEKQNPIPPPKETAAYLRRIDALHSEDTK